MRKQSVSVAPAYEDDEFEIFSAPNATGSPDRKLLTAMLERAILDYVGNDQREIDDASEWIFGEKHEGALRAFSFAWVCQHLDLDAPQISKLIEQMPKRGSRKIAPWYFKNQNDLHSTTHNSKQVVALVSSHQIKREKEPSGKRRHLALVG